MSLLRKYLSILQGVENGTLEQDANGLFFALNTWYIHSETSDKAFKAIVTIQPLSDLLYQILKNAVPVNGSPVSSSKIPAHVALAAGEFRLYSDLRSGRATAICSRFLNGLADSSFPLSRLQHKPSTCLPM